MEIVHDIVDQEMYFDIYIDEEEIEKLIQGFGICSTYEVKGLKYNLGVLKKKED